MFRNIWKWLYKRRVIYDLSVSVCVIVTLLLVPKEGHRMSWCSIKLKVFQWLEQREWWEDSTITWHTKCQTENNMFCSKDCAHILSRLLEQILFLYAPIKCEKSGKHTMNHCLVTNSLNFFTIVFQIQY